MGKAMYYKDPFGLMKVGVIVCMAIGIHLGNQSEGLFCLQQVCMKSIWQKEVLMNGPDFVYPLYYQSSIVIMDNASTPLDTFD